jgi:hypothetical protein
VREVYLIPLNGIKFTLTISPISTKYMPSGLLRQSAASGTAISKYGIARFLRLGAAVDMSERKIIEP